mmetsp:Transcript_49428/g.114562  ORF Transcript_49428/g.114562 Transcript_49428/m.114562 type:complete len:202 (-) Transcript_49428:1561-2166(-)
MARRQHRCAPQAQSSHQRTCDTRGGRSCVPGERGVCSWSWFSHSSSFRGASWWQYCKTKANISNLIGGCHGNEVGGARGHRRDRHRCHSRQQHEHLGRKGTTMAQLLSPQAGRQVRTRRSSSGAKEGTHRADHSSRRRAGSGCISHPHKVRFQPQPHTAGAQGAFCPVEKRIWHLQGGIGHLREGRWLLSVVPPRVSAPLP